MIETTMIVFILVNLFSSTYLKIRNILALYKPKTEFAEKVCTEEEYIQMQKYNRDKLVFSITSSVWNNLKEVIIINFRVYQVVYVNFFKNSMFSELLFFLASVNFNSLADIPFELFNTFIIEQAHGFNTMTISLFVSDFLKRTLILNIILVCTMSIVLKVIKEFLQSFWLYLWMCMAVLQICMVVIWPVYIKPLFNKFNELEDGTLRDKINVLCKKIGFVAQKIFVMDGSKRSSHSNAYFVGLLKEKRIVLYDTLIKQLSEEEIIAVLCHEFGHWYKVHTLKLVGIVLCQQLFYFWMANLILNNEYFIRKLFFADEPLVIKLYYVSWLLNITEFPVQLFMNIVSRIYEREADMFAIDNEYGEQLKSGLIKLGKENKGNVSQDKWYSMFYNSHPTNAERVKMIDEELSKKK